MSEAAANKTAPETKGASVRLPTEAVRKLGIIAQHTNRSIGEIVGDWIGTRLAREYRRVVGELNQELGGEG